jgi:small subunit ribosomal protein S6
MKYAFLLKTLSILATIPKEGGFMGRNYELTVILHPKMVEEGKKDFASIIEKYGISIKKDEDWGHKKLAYPIKEQNEGFYLFKYVEAKPEIVHDITHEFMITQSILRSMFVVIDGDIEDKSKEKPEEKPKEKSVLPEEVAQPEPVTEPVAETAAEE